MDDLALQGGKPVLAADDYAKWPKVEAEEKAAVLEVLERGVLSGLWAPATRAFEEEFAKAHGAKHALLTHCGTSALQLCVGALGIGAGDEVIVPAYSFIATAFAVLLQGAVPVFVDVDEEGHLDPALVPEAISHRTKAIMPVHVHGAPADLGALQSIASKAGLALIEDAAQAHLATWGGRPVGALGACGGFSLQSSKNLSAGEGGVLLTNRDDVALAANRLRTFGQDVEWSDRDHYDLARALDGHRALSSDRLGSMYRGNEMMAAFARAAFAKLPARTAAAQENARGLSARLRALPGVRPPKDFSDRTSAHHKYRVAFDPREIVGDLPAEPRARRALVLGARTALLHALRAEGVEVVLWQDGPMNEHPVFQRLEGFGRGVPWNDYGPQERWRIQQNYRSGRYAKTQALLDASIVLFSQTCPLVAQGAEVVARVGDAFEKVWAKRATLAGAAREAAQAKA